MSDGMYEAMAGKPSKTKVPREVQINAHVDVLVFKDSVLITNKKEKTTIALKKVTLKKIMKELK
jgi:hypothetical protein